jgi:hypothetical protein
VQKMKVRFQKTGAPPPKINSPTLGSPFRN